MRTTTTIAAIITVAAVFLLVESATAQKAIRIKFERGAVSAVVSGHLSGFKSKKTYVIRVRSGQALSTSQIGSLHNITLFIEDPNGDDVTDADASCNNRKEVSPTIAGDYRLTVFECQKADPWRGTFRFRVSVR